MSGHQAMFSSENRVIIARCAIGMAAFLSVFCVSPTRAEVTWGADAVQVRGKVPVNYVEDYATNRYGSAWEFDESSPHGMENLSGAVDVKIQQGVLKFSTTKETVLNGGGLDQPGSGQIRELIAQEWRREQYPWVVRIRLSQSLEYSDWTIITSHSAYGRRARTEEKRFVVRGKDVQVVTIPMGVATRVLIDFQLKTKTPGNNLAIDWVRIERISAPRYFRKTFDIPEAPVQGMLALGVNAHYKLYINGHLVQSHGGKRPFQRRINVAKGFESYLKLGTNTIAVEVETFSSNSSPTRPKDYFFLQGKIFTQSGGSVSIQTDGEWKGTYRAKPGWDQVGFDDSKWKRVRVKGSIEKAHLDGDSKSGTGGFREPPYMGRILVDTGPMSFPFFSEKGLVILPLRVIGIAPENNNIHYAVARSGEKKEIRSGKITLVRGKAPYDTGSVTINDLGPGVYQVYLEYEHDRKIVARRAYEIAVVGKIPQASVSGASYEEGMDLVLQDTVDPVVAFKEGNYISDEYLKKTSKTSNIGKKLIGAVMPGKSPRTAKSGGFEFVETASHRNAWLSFKYSIKNIHVPHLAVIEYPVDRERNSVFVLGEGTAYRNLGKIGANGGVPRSVGGAYTENIQDAGPVAASFRMLFWPNQKRGTITLVNAGRRHQDRAAMGRVKIYEITNGLPALDPSRVPQDKFIGPYSERIDRTIPRVFYSGPLEAQFPYVLLDGYFNGYYAAWYNTIANFIRYLKFTGQNSFFAGVYMYYGGWFPSGKFQGDARDGANYQGAGWEGGAIALMARMFEANNLKLVLGVQFFGAPALLKADNVTDNEVKEGRRSLRFITANGLQSRGYGTFNFLLPEVRDTMLDLAHEIADRYGSYPGIKGITWMRAPRFAPSINDPNAKDGLMVGYGDQTISLFGSDTGITVPGFSGNDRFRERYLWLNKQVESEWKSWRAKKVYELDSEIARVFKEKRNDWKVWRLADYPLPGGTLDLWKEGKISYLDTYRNEGLDPALYGKSDQLSLVPVLNWTGDRLYRDKLGKVREGRAIREFNREGNHSEYFGGTGVFLRIGFMTEYTIKTNRNWLWRRMRVVGNTAPAGHDFSEQVEQLLEGFDPEVVILGWDDGGHIMGHEQQIRNVVMSLD